MKTYRLMAMASAALILASCNKNSAVECTNLDGQATINAILTEQIVQATRDQLGTTAAAQPQTNEAKIRATVAQIKILIEDIRTTQKNENSTKRSCGATLKLVMPLNMIANAEKFRATNQLAPISSLTDAVGLQRTADSFTHQLTYSVQPTDDKKKVYGEVEAFGPVANALGEIIATHMVLPIIEASQQSEAAAAQAQQALIDQQTQAQSQADLELATAENKLAVQAYTEVWKALPDPIRAQNVEIQRAWAKKKTADCNIRAAETSTDPLIKEATRLRCETEQTQGRVEELKGLL
jgi:uncharacterized protein YecT (DUF1311 family)